MQSVTCEVVTDARYTVSELRRWVCHLTRRQTPESTFRYWRSKAGIKPDSDRLYGDEELNYLCDLSDWLASDHNRTIKQFNQHKSRNHGY